MNGDDDKHDGKREESDQTEPMAPVDGGEPDDKTSILPESAWAGRAEVPPPVGGLRGSAPYQTVPEAPPHAPRTWWTPVLLGLLALGLVGIVVLAAWLMTRDRGPAPQPTPTATVAPTTPAAQTTTPPAPSPTPSPQPELVEVPVLVGRTQDQAVTELDRLGLSYRFEYRQASAPQGTVIETRPAAGEKVAPRSTVTLVISLGQPESPTPTATEDGD